MFPKISVCIASLLLSVSAFASDIVYAGGGTLAQIVDGGGTHSVITLVNLDSAAASYTLYFYSDAGAPMSLNTTAGNGSSLSGVLPVGGAAIIQTNGNGAAVLQGYGVLVTSSQVAGSAVFGIPLTGTPYVEASCPLDTGFDDIVAFPFDQTTATTGLALANSFGDGAYQVDGPQPANLAIAFYDLSGNKFYSTSMQLAYGQHTAFMLPSQFPQTLNKSGTMVITSTDTSGKPYAIKALALRANLAGTTFTTITPVIPCNYSSTAGACTN